MIESLLALDGSILLWIQENLRADWLTPFILTVTKLGNVGFIWILISLGLCCFKKTRRAGLAGILGLMCSLAFNNIFLKNLIQRTRPYEVVEGIVLLTKKAGDFSFPSGHTGSSFACATAVCLMLRGTKLHWRWLLLAFAALMGYTRLYIGIHYPTDVFCGALTGALCGYVGYRAVSFADIQLKNMLERQKNKK